MNRTIATTKRILLQVRHDHRTIALIILVPTILMGILSWMLSGIPNAFNEWGGPLLGIFPLIVMFLITSVATLRERVNGTLERLLTLPIKRIEFIGAYALSFCVLGAIQAMVAASTSIYVFGLDTNGNTWAVVIVAILDAVLGTALGLLASAMARTEFQAVQFMPVFLIPQFLLGGFIISREDLPRILHYISDLMPLSYSIDALNLALVGGALGGSFWGNIAKVIGFALVALFLGGMTLRRSSK
jgi:ABC-2 type transport system permease protein